MRVLEHIQKESNFTDDLNHKTSRKIVEMAKYANYGLVVEDIKETRSLGEKKFTDGKDVPIKIVSSRNGGTKTWVPPKISHQFLSDLKNGASLR